MSTRSIAIQYASSFLASFKGGDPTVTQMLSEALERKLQDHWYEEEPERGQAYRAVKVTAEGKPDSLLVNVARLLEGADTEISSRAFLESLPCDLCLWIDPSTVSYRQGSNYIVNLWQSSPSPLFVRATISSPVTLRKPSQKSSSQVVKMSMSPPRTQAHNRFPREEHIHVA
jgi:hypothetical protein